MIELCVSAKTGLVLGRAHARVSPEDRIAQAVDLETKADALVTSGTTPIEPTAEEKQILSMGLNARRMTPTFQNGRLKVVPTPLSIDPERMPGITVTALRASAVAIRAAVDDASYVDANIHTESVIGQPLAWPRAHRSRLLTETDYVDLPGWRAGKSDAVLKAADAHRQALRDLPKTHPDPASVVWPDKPAGL